MGPAVDKGVVHEQRYRGRGFSERKGRGWRGEKKKCKNRPCQTDATLSKRDEEKEMKGGGGGFLWKSL